MTDREEYFGQIGMSKVAAERAEKLISVADKLFNLSEFDVLVTEAPTDQSAKSFDSLYIFWSDKNSASNAVEFKNFMTMVQFDHCPLSKYYRILFHAKNYEFATSSPESLLTVNMLTLPSIGTDMRATGVNCDYLLKVVSKYFLPKKD